MGFSVLASDFHLTPDNPREIAVFVEFTRRVVAGAERFYVLGDLFNFWVGPGNLGLPGLAPVLDALLAVSLTGTEVTLLLGNRDFLLGAKEAERVRGSVVGEELAVTLHGRRYLLLHGDSLCTEDVGYQRSKVVLRSGFVRWLSRVLPLFVSIWIARRLRGASKRSTSRKMPQAMGIVADAVHERFREGYEALVCGHVHDPGLRRYGADGRGEPVYVLGAWDEGGVYGVIDADGVRLERFEPTSRSA